MPLPRLSRTLLAAALTLLPAALSAQGAPTTRVRGTVARLADDAIVVKSREGDEVTIRLAPNWTVSGLERATLAEIKPGAFVGTAALPQPGGDLKAVSLFLFPEGVRSGEGHRAWDLMPESTMTNATMASAVDGVSGPVLSLAYEGGSKRVVVAPDTVIVKAASAERSDLVAGAPVLVTAQRDATGALTASRVTVGNRGVAPPM